MTRLEGYEKVFGDRGFTTRWVGTRLQALMPKFGDDSCWLEEWFDVSNRHDYLWFWLELSRRENGLGVAE